MTRPKRFLSIQQKNSLIGICFILPALSALLLLVLYPMLNGFYLSFFNTNLVNRNTFVGLRYYGEMLTKPDFYQTIFTTIRFTLLVVVGHFMVGGLFAGLLNKPFPGRTLYRVILVLPWVIPEVSVGLIWKWIFNPVYGLVNSYLLKFRLLKEPKAWLSDPKTAFAIVVFIAIWKGFPMIMLMITAGLQTLSSDVIEAAIIDGSSRGQLLRYIIIPSLKPVLLSSLILDTLWWFKHFTLVYMMTQGGPENATNIVSIDIYKTAFEYFKYGQAAAMSAIVFIICFVISQMQRRALSEKTS